eukprot:364948-Chlamydomonas_euryale.AAC.4
MPTQTLWSRPSMSAASRQLASARRSQRPRPSPGRWLRRRRQAQTPAWGDATRPPGQGSWNYDCPASPIAARQLSPAGIWTGAPDGGVRRPRPHCTCTRWRCSRWRQCCQCSCQSMYTPAAAHDATMRMEQGHG